MPRMELMRTSARFDECLSPEQAKALRDDLDNLRACDPAVGSEHFRSACFTSW